MGWAATESSCRCAPLRSASVSLARGQQQCMHLLPWKEYFQLTSPDQTGGRLRYCAGYLAGKVGKQVPQVKQQTPWWFALGLPGQCKDAPWTHATQPAEERLQPQKAAITCIWFSAAHPAKQRCISAAWRYPGTCHWALSPQYKCRDALVHFPGTPGAVSGVCHPHRSIRRVKSENP